MHCRVFCAIPLGLLFSDGIAVELLHSIGHDRC